jgi:hypothetical protein
MSLQQFLLASALSSAVIAAVVTVLVWWASTLLATWQEGQQTADRDRTEAPADGSSRRGDSD